MEGKIPFIHLFQTPLGYYLYDVNTNDIVKINKNTYEYLNGENVSDKEIENEINLLENNGYLKCTKVEETEHPATELLPFYLDSKVGQLVLQVTQNCNLRCDYCVYSGKYNTREHANKHMSFETAKKAINFLKKHSRERDTVVIGFYGGEPLLEFELIKKCVEYAQTELQGKKINYSLTTNATLLTDEIMDYFIEYSFMITVSIDGPKEMHDKERRFADGNRGSFDIVMSNIKRIREKNIDYFNKNVRFNAVLLTDKSFQCVDQFFKGDEIFQNAGISAHLVSDAFSKQSPKVNEVFVEERQYALFKFYLAQLNRIDIKYASPLLYNRFIQMKNKRGYGEAHHRVSLLKKWHRGGPCIPGVLRLFVTVDEKLLPCEKVSEIADIVQLGTLDGGFDIDKVSNILNIEKYTMEKCHNCWAYSECSLCFHCCNNNENEIALSIIKKCEQVKSEVDNIFKDYTVLQELGCDFGLEE